MTDEGDIRPKVKSTKLLWLGGTITAVYLAGLVYYCYSARTQMAGLSPNEVGDFLAGAFSPLAFLWLVLGYFQQGRELENSANALWLQGQELQNSVTQQRELVEVTREQLAHEREIASAEQRRILAEIEGQAARAERAKVDEHNALIRQILSMGVLATEEAKEDLRKNEEEYSRAQHHIALHLNSKCMNELATILPQLKAKTTNMGLLGAITALQNELDNRVSPGFGIEAVEGLRERIQKIDLAVARIEKELLP